MESKNPLPKYYYRLKCIDEISSENIEIDGMLKPEEWKTLEAYVVYANELFETKFVQEGMRAKLKIPQSVCQNSLQYV